ncbi:MAG: hypothetical protein ACRDRI_24550 [Pseudonocardiaceae bacterium]
MPTPPLADIPLHDAEGTLIQFQCRVEQITVDQARGAPASRLHKKGQVIGRDIHRVYVRFDLESQVIALPPHVVRVLETLDGS